MFCGRKPPHRINAARRMWRAACLVGFGCGLAACGAFTGPSSGDHRTAEIDGMEQVFVGEGEFLMGSTAADPDAEADEFPQHAIHLEGFWIDRTEVSNRQYALCVDAKVCDPPLHSRHFGRPDVDDHPVIGVSWFEAAEYCAWAERRLPSEAEWEKAARGTDGRIFPWGDEAPTPARAAYDLGDGTTPVGTHPEGASPYGALDMAGNAWEWTADTYDPEYYAVSPREDPPGPRESVNWRVIRGGSSNTAPRALRAANRFWAFPKRGYFDGFRCASDG